MLLRLKELAGSTTPGPVQAPSSPIA
jgi:hypothetical protein